MRGPQGVRLVLTDGTVLPVEVEFSHYDDRTVGIWAVTARVERSRIRMILVRSLPPRTMIGLW